MRICLIALTAFMATSTAVCGQASAALMRPYSGVSFGPGGASSSETFSNVQGIAVDQTSGDVFVYEAGEGGRVYKFDAAGEPAAFSGLAGSNVIQGVGAAREPGESEIAVAPAGSPAGTEGDIYVAHSPGPVQVYSPTGVQLGTLGEGETCGVAVDPAGHLFIGTYPDSISEYVPSANPPTIADLATTATAGIEICNLAVDATDRVYAANYEGHNITRVETLGAPTSTLITPGARTIAVDPTDNTLFADRGELLAEYSATGALALTFGAGQLAGSVGVAVDGPSDDVYASDAGSGRIKMFEAVRLPSPVTQLAEAVTSTTSTLRGTVNPEGVPLEACVFEYGEGVNYGQTAPCVAPDAAEVGAGSASVSVHAEVSGLSVDTQYHFRLVAKNEHGAVQGPDEVFSTTGPPTITEVSARNAERTTATLAATIDPHGFDTSYYFEWGQGVGYGNRVPADGESALPGMSPQAISIDLSGLSSGTRYHYRVIASSAGGSAVASPDHEFETLNSCGLPDQRCFELVSPKELGPTAAPGRFLSSKNIMYQAAPFGPGSLAYTIEGGLPGATRGAEVLYKGIRGPGGWTSSQIDAPIVAQNQRAIENVPATFLGLSPDLSCGVLRSPQPLTPDPAASLQIEAGGENLYRAEGDGTFTLVTVLPPVSPEPAEDPGYNLVGMSENCQRIIFSTTLTYPGLVGEGGTRLYEWNDGTLTAIARVPGGEEEVATEIEGGGGLGNNLGAVSRDGSRVFFTATSQSGNDSGNRAVFVRINATQTVDVSQSALATDTGATYQAATPDGSRVYFTANAGLTSKTSVGGTDLYEYNVETSRLTDLSVGMESGEAAVGGVLGFAQNGSHVYFAARGQLVPGRGRTFAENLADETYSIFDATGGRVVLVGSVTDGDVESGGAVIHSSSGALKEWRSRVSSDGRYLLFESSVALTDSPSGGVPQIYLYDADDTAESTVCVSCRFDNRAPFAPGNGGGLTEPGASNTLYAPASLVIAQGAPEVFFVSRNPLAPGSVEGEYTLYEWSHDQVFLVARQPAGSTVGDQKANVAFIGASADGASLYLFDAESLNWENPEGRPAAWDARVEGGFTQPPASSSCNPDVEFSCQTVGGASPRAGIPATSAFVGPGNVSKKKHHKKKHHKKKHHKKKHHKKKHHKKAARPGKEAERGWKGHARQVKGDGGEGK